VILVMEHGRIVEQGPRRVAARQRPYAALYQSQFAGGVARELDGLSSRLDRRDES